MTKEQLKKAIEDFFNDTSRPENETRDVLLEMIDDMQMMAESIGGEDDDYDEV